MKFILLSLVLLALFQCAIMEQVSDVNESAYAEIKKIESTKFGKTIVDTVAVQLATGDPAGDLITLLQNIEDNIRTEQDEDDEYIQRLQQECDDNLAKLESEIEKARARSAELQAELDEKIPLRDEKVQTLADKNEFRQLLEQKIVQIDQRKELKDQEWTTEQEEHDHAAEIIQKAKEIIENEVKSQSFLQQKNSFAQVANSVRSGLKENHFRRKSWNSFMNLLAQVTQDLQGQADQSAVQKVIELCEDILDKIAESREIERRDYQHWVDEYNTTRTGLTDKLDKVTNRIAELELRISTLNKRISDAQFEKSEQDKRADEKQTQHDEKLQYCEDENNSYADRREARDDERSIVSQTIGLLQANLRTFRRYISDRQSN